MCFSAPASFTASAVLALIGTALVIQIYRTRFKNWNFGCAKTSRIDDPREFSRQPKSDFRNASGIKSKRLLPLALIPCFFAIQQCAEGFTWLRPEDQVKNIFLFFAYFFWPVWIPFSLWFPEKTGWRKQILAICLGIGVATGSLLALLIPYATANTYHCSIHYSNSLNVPWSFDLLGIFFYGISTLVPPFISCLKKMWVLGLAAALSGIAIFWIDRLSFVSLWCFFAAIFSLSLFFILNDRKIKKNIDLSGRLIRLCVGILLLIYACWKMSWIAFIFAVFVFFESLMSWCVVYQILGKNSCPVKKKS